MSDKDDMEKYPELDHGLINELEGAASQLNLSQLSDGDEIEPSLGTQAQTMPFATLKGHGLPETGQGIEPGKGPDIGQDSVQDPDPGQAQDIDLGIETSLFPGHETGRQDTPGKETQAAKKKTASARRLKKTSPKAGDNGEGDTGSEGKLPGIPKRRQGRGLMFRFFVWLFWAGTGLCLFGLLVIFACYAYFSQGLPSVDGLRNYRPKTVTYFYSNDGQVIGEYSHERRIVRPLSAMPESIKQAYLATEDANFYVHGGVNPVAVVRAAYNTIFEDHLQGGSTITQQLVRSFLLSNERKIERKIKEMILAFRVEAVLTKDQIFELYLNQIYLGQGAYGVEAAAQTYFDKHVEQLTVAESAMLAGITQSPQGKNPITRPDEARRRQMYSLSRMEEVGYLTRQQAQEAANEILNIVGERANPNTTVAPYFTEHVRRLLAEKYGEESLYNDGWKVFSTLDVKAQEAADAAVARGLWEYARRRGFKGPVLKLGDQAEIDSFRAMVDKKIGKGTLEPNRLYQAVILELTEGQGLRVGVGNFEGLVAKKNLEWVLPKGSLAKQLSPGDVVWVRLAPADAAPGTPLDKQAALASIATGAAASGHQFVLEQRTDVQAALLSMDLADGGVRAMVGGRDFSESQFNRATQSQRQPGSAFKPIVYTAAMDNGFTPGSIMVDGPVVIDDLGSQKRWKPLNSDQKFLGPMTLYNALVASRNLVSVKVLERV
ncbi:MAG: transglycosylase domain-containing protein, partial [Deltaproteobacteria bacterium]|nr:transglycosylase domain-containing protein [Deltaproteobacteria bacterium]